MKLWVIKLGGSIITEKEKDEPIIRETVLQALCEELATAYASYSDLHFIVLHGAGSLGHPLARQYNINGAPLDHPHMLGMSEIMVQMRHLTEVITTHLRQCGVPALPLQTSSLIDKDGDALRCLGQPILKQLLRVRGVPVFGGDTIVQQDGTITIASADALAVLLAQQFEAERIIFATNVAGVYASFPPGADEKAIPTLSRHDLQELLGGTFSQSSIDVTGGMQGKLQELLTLHNVRVTIFDGILPENMRAALADRTVGTEIAL